jgi:hypothetical protein
VITANQEYCRFTFLAEDAQHALLAALVKEKPFPDAVRFVFPFKHFASDPLGRRGLWSWFLVGTQRFPVRRRLAGRTNSQCRRHSRKTASQTMGTVSHLYDFASDLP